MTSPIIKIENAIGASIWEMLPNWDGSKFQTFWRNVVNTGKVQQEKELIYNKSAKGMTYWDLTITPVYDRGIMKYCIVNTTDVTDYVQQKILTERQAEVIKNQKDELEKVKESLLSALKEKDEFFSTISHEFKTPLTVMIAAVQAMDRLFKNEMPEKANKYIRRIRQNSYRQLRLVNNILDITRIQSGYAKLQKRNMDIVSLTRAIVDSVALYAKQKNIEIKFSSLLLNKVIAVDDEKYERILLNLLSNAIKFTPQNKSIYVSVSRKRKMICIEIRDEGVGIPPDKQSIIFERFGQVSNSLTEQAEGTGIGLSLVKTLITALGGKISLKSQVGKGSTFSLFIPIEKVSENEKIENVKTLTDSRLIQSVAIEFSDIYI